MKLLKRMPKGKPGYTVTVHFVPHVYEYDEHGRPCHKVAGYSIKKSEPFDPTKFKTEDQLYNELIKEIRNGKKSGTKR